jgi:hypothetical protein
LAGPAEQVSMDGEPHRRRRRRRGRGGNRDTRQDQRGPGDSSQPAQDHDHAPMSEAQQDFPAQPPEQRVRQDAVESAPPPAMPVETATREPAAQPMPESTEQRPSQTYTVWSSSPGEGQHFGPKE